MHLLPSRGQLPKVLVMRSCFTTLLQGCNIRRYDEVHSTHIYTYRCDLIGVVIQMENNIWKRTTSDMECNENATKVYNEYVQLGHLCK